MGQNSQSHGIHNETPTHHTLPETNSSSLKNGWLEYNFPIREAYHSGVMFVSGSLMKDFWVKDPPVDGSDIPRPTTVWMVLKPWYIMG